MFSPLAGTWEDAATGSAATPLAGFLLQLSGAESGAWEIVQGVEMGRPSLLRTTARRGAGRHPRDGRRRLRASVAWTCGVARRGMPQGPLTSLVLFREAYCDNLTK